MMQSNQQRATEAFTPYAARYQPIIDAAKSMSKGNFYLTGGAIYRTLAQALRGAPEQKIKDLDFVADELLPVPQGWTWEQNSCGGTKVTAPFVFDIHHFDQNFQLDYLQLPPTIESYLASVPLTIQSIAYDPQTKQVFGDIGIESIIEGCVSVNNRATFELRRHRHMPKLITVAQELWFKVRMPDSAQQ